MRKGAANRVALALGLVAFTACQSADRSPVASTATASDPGQEQGTARAAVEPVPVPGKPSPVPIPGRGGSGTKPAPIPVPGGPQKAPGPGATPSPGASPSPGVTPTPTPDLQVLSFRSSSVLTATGSPIQQIRSPLAVSGMTGTAVKYIVSLRADIPDNDRIDEIRLHNPRTGAVVGSASLFSFSSDGALSGSDLGTSCVIGGGATTFTDDTAVTAIEIWEGTPPYSGTYNSNFATLQAMSGTARFPDSVNGDWELEVLFRPTPVGTTPPVRRLLCWELVIQYRP